MKKICPMQRRVMELLSMAIILEDRKVFRDKNGKFVETPVDPRVGGG